MAALAAGRARAGSWSATVEPGYSHVETDVTDQAGATTHEISDSLLQRYRLSLDLPLTQYLVAAAGGNLVDTQAWRVKDGLSSRLHGADTTFYGRLTLGAPTLNGGVGFDRNEQRILSAGSVSYVTESYTGYLLWRPLQLPELELRASHVNGYDATRRARDVTNDSASLGLRYQAPSYDLRYVLSWMRNDDHVNQSRAATVEQDVFATRSDTLFAGRTSTYVNASLQARTVTSEARGPDATFTQRQLPIAGLSAIETAPTVPQDVNLVRNDRLVDGDLRTSAAVNVGFDATDELRDVGAQFADAVTEVNTIYVWIDDPLTPEVGAALAASAHVFQSDDNQLWTELPRPVAAPSPFENRLEIPIPKTRARYLKVVLTPLGVTTDAEYRDTSVTEVQFLLVTPAAEVPRRASMVSGNANGFARTVIVRSIDLAHDVSATVAHDTDTDLTRWTLVNGLSARHGVLGHVTANARVARQDQDLGVEREGFWQWNAGLVGRPLPAAYWSLVYSGNTRDPTKKQPDRDIAHSLSALGRADLYDGISGQLSGSVTSATRGTRNGQNGQAAGTLSLTPNRWVSFSFGGLFSRTRTTDSADDSAVVSEYARVDGTLSLTPAPALSAAGTVSRVLLGRPTTLGTLQLNYFPLRGDLQVSVGYSRNFDTASEAVTEILSPMLRWNVRRGVSVTGSYTWLRNDSRAALIESRALLLTLLITL
jgi:hypothetical protein